VVVDMGFSLLFVCFVRLGSCRQKKPALSRERAGWGIRRALWTVLSVRLVSLGLR
jgi:hypothetical protein